MKQLVIRIFLNEMGKAAKNVNFVVINVSLEQGSQHFLYPEYHKEYALCTQEKLVILWWNTR